VVDLVALLEAPQNGDGVFDAGLVDDDRLEAALEGGVLFDVLAVLVEGGGADAVQFAAGEHRLEKVAGVHGAFGLPCPDDGVEFVDEEDDLAFARRDLLEDGLQALLELAAELGAGDEGAHVEGDHALFLQAFGNVAANDALGEALGDGGLADAGLADEDRIVLGAAGEYLDDAPNLFVAADDGVELALGGGLGEVAAIGFQGLVGLFRILGGDALVAADLFDGGVELLASQAAVLEGLAEGAVGGNHGQQEVLDADKVVLELAGLELGVAEQGGEVLGQVHAGGAGRGRDLGKAVEIGHEAAMEAFEVQAGLEEDGRRERVLLFEESNQEVFGVDLLVAEAGGESLSAAERVLRFFGVAIEIHRGASQATA